MFSFLVYSANRNVFAENVGRRLENFFWRIWSDKRLLHHLSGEQVAAQFSSINEGGYIRTTPRSSPRSSRSLGSYPTEASSSTITYSSSQSFSQAPYIATSSDSSVIEEDKSTPKASSLFTQVYAGSHQNTLHTAANCSPSEEQDEDNTATPTPSSPFADMKSSASGSKEYRSTVVTQPPPILKTSSSAGSTKSTKSTAFLSPPPEEKLKAAEASAVVPDEEIPTLSQDPLATGSPPPRRYVSTRFSEEVSVSIPKTPTSTPRFLERSTRNQAEGSQKSGKRNPVVVASTGVSKRRPAVLRQRSSQSSQAKPSPSPPSPSMQRRSAGSTPTTGRSPPAQPVRKTRAASPRVSKGRRPTPAEPEPSDEENALHDSKSRSNKCKEHAPLVEPDFRSVFADKTRPQHRSFTNLSTLDRKSSAITAIAGSYQASGLLDFGHSSSWSSRGQGRDAFRNEIIPLKAPAPSGPKPFKEEAPAPLPRTKSQLTLLLERDKAGSQEQSSKAPEEK